MRPSFFYDSSNGQSFFVASNFFWLPKQTFRNERNERNGTRRGPLWGAEWSGATEVSGENVCKVTKKILRVTRKKLWPCEIKNKKMMGVSNVATIYHVKASNFVLKVSKRCDFLKSHYESWKSWKFQKMRKKLKLTTFFQMMPMNEKFSQKTLFLTFLLEKY